MNLSELSKKEENKKKYIKNKSFVNKPNFVNAGKRSLKKKKNIIVVSPLKQIKNRKPIGFIDALQIKQKQEEQTEKQMNLLGTIVKVKGRIKKFYQ